MYKSTTLRQRLFGRQPTYRHTTGHFRIALLAAKTNIILFLVSTSASNYNKTIQLIFIK